jgi:hypothetical protein
MRTNNARMGTGEDKEIAGFFEGNAKARCQVSLLKNFSRDERTPGVRADC